MSASTELLAALSALDDAQLAVMRAGSALDASIAARDAACVAYYTARDAEANS